jgi:uncharacterized protein DUF2513
MARNMELIRHLLLKLEAVQGGSLVAPNDSDLALQDRFAPEVVTEQFELLVNRGLLLGDSSVTADGSLFFRGLSWAGYDLLDAIRDQSVWAKLRKAVGKHLEEISFDVLKELAKRGATEGFESITGFFSGGS